MGCSPPGSSVHGILQARILEWVAISFSRGSSQHRSRTWVSRISRRVLYRWATWKTPWEPRETLKLPPCLAGPLSKKSREWEREAPIHSSFSSGKLKSLPLGRGSLLGPAFPRELRSLNVTRWSHCTIRYAGWSQGHRWHSIANTRMAVIQKAVVFKKLWNRFFPENYYTALSLTAGSAQECLDRLSAVKNAAL